MATYKISLVKKLESENILNKDFDFKTMYNMEFTSTEDNIQLLKKMCLILYNEITILKRGSKYWYFIMRM